MSAPVRFLHSFTRALATISLYWERHPARERSIEVSFERLQQLLAEDPQPQFSFLLHEVIYGHRSLRELQDWEWTRRLAEAGVQRFELEVGVTLDEFGAFLEEVSARLAGVAVPPTAARPMRSATIRFGAVGFRPSTGEQRVVPEKPAAKPAYLFHEEAAAVKW